MGAPAKTLRLAKPNVVDHHDYRAFLREWISYLEESETGFSLRQLARESGLSVSGLSMMLRGHRALSASSFQRLRSHLRLGDVECRHLELLREMSEAPTAELRARAVAELQRRPSYRHRHPREFETYHYLKSWYFVAIREMAAFPDFKFDPHWVHTRLRGQVPLEEVGEALVFLERHGFIERGRVGVVQKALECLGGVFKMALGAFHKQMLAQVASAIDQVPADQRHIVGHTVAVSAKDLPRLREILNEAMGKIERLGENQDAADAVYHIALAAVPLTKPGDGNE